jgi:hypothetical protein
MAGLTDLAPLFSACGCWQVGALSALARVGPECAEAAQETSDAATEANTKGTLAFQFTQDVATLLEHFQRDEGLGLDTFQQIKALVEDQKTRKALALAREMDDIAIKMSEKATHMTKTLQDAANEVMPENVRHEMEETDHNTRAVGTENNTSAQDDEASALMELLGHADADVEQVQTNTRDMEQMDLLSAGRSGPTAFRSVAEKENVAVKILQEIKSVSEAIVDTIAIGGGGGAEPSLCAQFMAAAAGTAALFKALRLSKLIERALETVRQLLESFMGFFDIVGADSSTFSTNLTPVKSWNNLRMESRTPWWER